MSDSKGNGGSKPADDKAERIRGKIAASQARSRGEAPARKAPKPARPRSPADANRPAWKKVVEDHPLALLAGSLVFGAIAASLLPASVGRKLGSRVLGLAALASDFGATYGNKAWQAAAEGARAGQTRLDDLGGTIADQGAEARRKAVELGSQAGRRAIELAESVAANARDARETALKRIGELSERARP